MEKIALEFLETVRRADSVVVLTGAGVSTDSGIPDFRSKNGLYSKVPPYIFELDFFLESPERFYELAREHLYPMLEAKPNVTHTMLAKLEELEYLKAVVTQNVDGLHQKAGSREVVELHGNLERAVCLNCGERYSVYDVLNMLEESEVPRCPKCGGLIKPDVVFFKEQLPMDALEYAFQLAEEADVFVTMGTSLVVYPAASLPTAAKSTGGTLVIMNRDPTPYDELADKVWRVELSPLSERVLEMLEGR